MQVRKPGFYQFSSRTMLGRPDNVENGFLIIPAIEYNGSGSGRVQIAIERTGLGRIFTRTIYDDIAHDWVEVLGSNSKYYLSSLGLPNLRFIQTTGTKKENEVYIDSVTGKPYKAKITNNDTNVTDKFFSIDNLSNSNLKKKYTIDDWEITEYADGSIDIYCIHWFEYKSESTTLNLPFKLKWTITRKNWCIVQTNDTTKPSLFANYIVDGGSQVYIKRVGNTGSGGQYISIYIRGEKEV